MTTSYQDTNESAARQYGEQKDNELSAGIPVVVPLAVPRIPQPIFAIVNAPLIKDVSREALLEWQKLRKEYVAVTEARCKAANEDVKAVLQSVRDSFDEFLLETICETRWDADLNELTDEYLMEKIKEITNSFKNRELPDIDDLFSEELKFDWSISDIEGRVTTYFHLVNEIIVRNGVRDLFVGEDGIKRKCKVLTKHLPGPLQKKVKNELEFRSGEAKASVRKLYAIVNNLALDLYKKKSAEARTTAKISKSGKTLSTKSFAKASGKKSVIAVGVTYNSKRSASTQPGEGAQRKISRPARPKQCFHCEGEHEFINCPTATEADKAAIREKRKAEYQARKQAGYQQRKRG